MINITNSGTTTHFFVVSDDKYDVFYGEGVLNLPKNSLSMVIEDASDIIAFKTISNNDTVFNAKIGNLKVEGEVVTKANVIEKLSNVLFGASGGGGGTVDAYTKAQTDALLRPKLERVELLYDGTSIKQDGVVKTFQEIYDLVDNTSKFVTLQAYDMWWLLPSMDYVGDAILFTNTDILSEDAECYRIIINSNNEISDYFIPLENRNLKKDDLTIETVGDKKCYPTVKAVNDALEGYVKKEQPPYVVTSDTYVAWSDGATWNVDYFDDGVVPSQKYRGKTFNEVAIGKGITKLDTYSFAACPNLTSVTIPSGITTYGTYVFSGSNLTSVVIEEGSTNIGGGMFFNCASLNEVTIPSTITTINTPIPFIGVPTNGTLYCSDAIYNRYKDALGNLNNWVRPRTLEQIDTAVYDISNNLETNYYTKAQSDNAYQEKGEYATYGQLFELESYVDTTYRKISDSYTKTEVDYKITALFQFDSASGTLNIVTQ